LPVRACYIVVDESIKSLTRLELQKKEWKCGARDINVFFTWDRGAAGRGTIIPERAFPTACRGLDLCSNSPGAALP
jgi:hypothetical protein